MKVAYHFTCLVIIITIPPLALYDINLLPDLYKKKNKLSEPTNILIEISFWLSDAVYRNNINEKCVIFFKTLTFDGCLAKYRLYMPFLRQYQTLRLHSRVCPANSTTWILFCRVKILSFINL